MLKLFGNQGNLNSGKIESDTLNQTRGVTNVCSPKGVELCSLPRMVTRLGEFSPLGRLFTLGSGWKITKVAQNFWPTFLHGQSNAFIFTKMG
jgi:hypothetical protein